MTLKTVALTDFLAPTTDWGETPVMPMPLGADCTALAMCEDGALLAILHLQAHELVQAIKSDTLFQRVAALKGRSSWAYLLISGGLEASKHTPALTIVGGVQTKWAWASVSGALATVQELGVVVIQLPNEADVGPAVARLGKRDRTAKRCQPLRQVETLGPAEDILLAIPGIGEKHMLTLLQETNGSLIWALIALTSRDTTVPGVGPKIKADARAVFGLRDDENICLISPGDVITPAAQQQQKAA
jgi:hypothetical protein